MTSWQRRSFLAAFTVAGLAASHAPWRRPPSRSGRSNVGAYPANPPWEYKAADGHFEGFEVDVVNDVAKRLSTTRQLSGLRLPGAVRRGSVSGRIDNGHLVDHHHARAAEEPGGSRKPYYGQRRRES